MMCFLARIPARVSQVDLSAPSSIMPAPFWGGVKLLKMLLCGRQAIDGDTAQVGPQIAEKLHLPQVTYVTEIKKDGNS